MGDNLVCSSNANPEPGYTWTDLSNGTLLSAQSSLVLTSSQAGQTISLQCVASNTIKRTLMYLGINITIDIAPGKHMQYKLNLLNDDQFVQKLFKK